MEAHGGVRAGQPPVREAPAVPAHPKILQSEQHRKPPTGLLTGQVLRAVSGQVGSGASRLSWAGESRLGVLGSRVRRLGSGAPLPLQSKGAAAPRVGEGRAVLSGSHTRSAGQASPSRGTTVPGEPGQRAARPPGTLLSPQSSGAAALQTVGPAPALNTGLQRSWVRVLERRGWVLHGFWSESPRYMGAPGEQVRCMVLPQQVRCMGIPPPPLGSRCAAWGPWGAGALCGPPPPGSRCTPWPGGAVAASRRGEEGFPRKMFARRPAALSGAGKWEDRWTAVCAGVTRTWARRPGEDPAALSRQVCCAWQHLSGVIRWSVSRP